LAYDYDEFQYRTLRSRAKRFETLIGRPEFTLDIDETVAEDEVMDREIGIDDAPLSFSNLLPPVALPSELLDLIKMDLTVKAGKVEK